MLRDDPLTKVLYVDVSKRTFHVEDRRDLFEKSVGGAGAAIELLHEECPQDADPLGPENVIVLAVGPLTGLFPLASKTVAMFKSPHTGNLGESHAGGRSAVSIRLAGYGAIVIKGASESPLYLTVNAGKVEFKDASSLWGIGSSFTVGRIIRERESSPGFRTIMRIGRASERLVSFACVTTETYRHFGRLGLGAVFGSKKLKALVVAGRRSLPVSDPKTYRSIYEEIYEAAVRSPVMGKYHDLGTAENVIPLNKLKGMPSRNLKEASSPAAEALSGEEFAEHYLGRRIACSHCPVGCIHLAALREPSEHEPYFYKTSMICYDYEPIFALGTMLGGSNPADVLRLMDAVETLGLDAMSTGVALAWATEAMERGNISTKDTGGIGLKWGKYASYIKAADLIVAQPNDFYRALARGVDHAAAKYGGRDFALAFGGNEMPGYHTGPGAYLTYLTGSRHSHLDSAGYSLDQKALAKDQKLTPEGVIDSLMQEEGWRQVLASLVICFFARGIYTPDVVRKALQTAGFEFTEDELTGFGARVLASKHAFKKREGFSPEDLPLPKRIFEVPTPLGNLSEDFLRKALELFATRMAE